MSVFASEANNREQRRRKKEERKNEKRVGKIRIEELTVKNPDKSKWESFCGKYEHPEGTDFIIDEVWMQDGELYSKAIDDGDESTFRLYPIGEDEFGRKGGMLKLKFGDGCLMHNDCTCKKL